MKFPSMKGRSGREQYRFKFIGNRLRDDQQCDNKPPEIFACTDV